MTRKMPPATWVVALGLAAWAPASSAEPFSESPLPHYLVRRAAGPVAVDGRLDEFAWAAAPQVDGFARILHHYGRVLQPTRARMVWDDEALYVAFTCLDPDLWALYSREDDPMWEEEVVEVFIDPDGDGRDYLELEVNPLNARVDLHIRSVEPDWLSDKDWDIAGLRTAVAPYGTVNDTSDVDAGWTAEMAIPWAAFAPKIVGGARPTVGDRWRLNLYRIERGAGAEVRARLKEMAARADTLRQRRQALGEGGDLAERARLEDELAKVRTEQLAVGEVYEGQTEYTAWSPTFQRGFHHPGRFGVVEFAP